MTRRRVSESIQVEDFLQPLAGGIGSAAGWELEERSHLRLPASINLGLLHCALSRGEIVAFDVAEEQPVRTQKQGVVTPTAVAECRQHRRPHSTVPGAILVESLWLHPQQEANAFHGFAPGVGSDLGHDDAGGFEPSDADSGRIG